MNFLIIGSGFGIYGYLPAVYKNSKKIFLNIKYKKKIEKRIELTRYLKRVTWYFDIKDINNKIDYVIIAQNPKKQFLIVKKILRFLKPKHLFLEKPICHTPNKSLNFVEFLHKNKIKFSVGYLFAYLNWYRYIKKNLTYNQKFEITWRIRLNKKKHVKLDCDESLFFKVVKTSFQQRRKTLRNSLKKFNIPNNIKEGAIFEKRPETLCVNDFILLTNIIADGTIPA